MMLKAKMVRKGKKNLLILSLFKDGSYEGTRYFETESNRGLFCRPAKVERLAQNGANSGGGDDTSGSAKAQITPLADSSKLSTSTSNLSKKNIHLL
jgi:hypothetical protein